MSFRSKYVPFARIALILNIAVIIDLSLLPPATAAPEISLSPSSGSVGTTVDVRGSGFVPMSSIGVNFNEEPISTTPENIRADVLGRFNAKFDVPQSIAGSAIVTASGMLAVDSASSEFTVLNDPPVAESLDVSTDEDRPLEITLNASDANGDDLTFAIVQDPEHGTLTNFDAVSGTVTYTPHTNYAGNDRFEFRASDGQQDSNTADVKITIIPVNRPPSTESQQLSVEENGELHITLTGSDPDGDELTFRITEEPVHGTLDGDPPNLVYRPLPDYHGNDSFAFVANDGRMDSNVSTINITVMPAKGPPTAMDVSIETSEGEPVTVTLIAADTNSDELHFIILSQPLHGTLGSVTPGSSTTASVTYSPEAGYIGEDSFTYRVDDGDRSSNIAMANIYIMPINNAPLVNNQSVNTTAGVSIEIILTGTDPDNDTLSFFIVEDPRRGTLGPVVSTGSTSASVPYTPEPDEYGSDSFTFRANDGALDSNLGRVSITVSPASSALPDTSRESDSQSGDLPAGAALDGAESNSGTGETSTGGGDDSTGPNTNTRGDTEGSINNELPIQDNVGWESVLQSAVSDTAESSTFLSGSSAWLLPGAIAGLASVIAFLGYRERRLRNGYTALQGKLMASTQQLEGLKESASNAQAKVHRLQDRVTFMVYMNRIHRILNHEKGKTARERILDVEYNKNKVSLAEYDNSKSIVKGQFEEIGSMLRSNPQLKDSFLDSFGELAIKVWWAIKQDVLLDERRGRKWESLEWLGSEVERYWSNRNGTSSSQT